MNWFAPNFMVNVRRGRKIPKWLLNWADDPLYTGGKMAVRNLVNLKQTTQHF